MSTLEVDRSSLDVVAAWFGQTLPKKRQSEDIEDSTQDGKRKQKKVTHKSKNPSEIVSQKDSTVVSWESKPGSTNLHVQGQGHSNDTDTCSSSVASFIQQKVNKKLMKATHRKREQGLHRGASDEKKKIDRMTKKHKSVQDSKFENEEEEEEEEESRLGMITKQRSVPSKWTATEPLKNKRKRKRKKKAKES
ncbi:uncharacterized protein LOC111107862 [Crassostrea virginica]